MKTESLGYHLLADMFECDAAKINDAVYVRSAMLEAAVLAKATVVTDVFHSFNPHGLSGVVVIAESHIAIHAWPEYATVAIDIFSCSDKMAPQRAIQHLRAAFGAKSVNIKRTARGARPLKEESAAPEVRIDGLG